MIAISYSCRWRIISGAFCIISSCTRWNWYCHCLRVCTSWRNAALHSSHLVYKSVIFIIGPLSLASFSSSSCAPIPPCRVVVDVPSVIRITGVTSSRSWVSSFNFVSYDRACSCIIATYLASNCSCKVCISFWLAVMASCAVRCNVSLSRTISSYRTCHFSMCSFCLSINNCCCCTSCCDVCSNCCNCNFNWILSDVICCICCCNWYSNLSCVLYFVSIAINSLDVWSYCSCNCIVWSYDSWRKCWYSFCLVTSSCSNQAVCEVKWSTSFCKRNFSWCNGMISESFNDAWTSISVTFVLSSLFDAVTWLQCRSIVRLLKIENEQQRMFGQRDDTGIFYIHFIQPMNLTTWNVPDFFLQRISFGE